MSLVNLVRKNAANQSRTSSFKSLFSFLKSNPNYRADIDGLRAIACLAVVLYHAFPGYLPGGFIGVDIFFVISGYLISSILYRHLFNQDNPGKVHIVDFYSRRARRIFPALILVLVTTLVLGYFVLLPEEYKLLGKHTFGASTYINNFMLYKETGNYFNVDSKFKPLLHLWSLGVEEQFYLIFPIFLWVIYKFNLNFVLSLTLFSVASFFANYIAVKHGHVSKAFFMPWSRFWELSLGAVLAYVEFAYANQLYQFKDSKFYKTVLAIFFRNLSNTNNQKILKNIISFIGLVLIVVGLISIKSNGVYPGKKALIPVFGAIFIIVAGKDAFINRKLLSNKVMVFLGLISYPLYLWHWSLLSLLYICDGGIPENHLKVIAILISLVLATITFLFIEQKLQYGKHGVIKAIVLFTVLIIVGCAGLKIKHDDVLPQRFNSQPYTTIDDKLRRENTKKYQTNYNFYISDQYIDKCKTVFPHWNDADTTTTCAFMNNEGDNNIALIGSSHAAQLFYGLSEYYKDSINSVAMFPVASQSAFLNLKANYEGRTTWYPLISKAYDYVSSHNNIKTVILSDLNANYYSDVENPNEKNFISILKNGARRSFEKLKNKKVLVLLDHPLVPYDPSLCSNRPFSFRFKESKCDYTFNRNIANMHKKAIIETAKGYPNVRIFDLTSLFCKGDLCKIKINGFNLYDDFNHLNPQGSLFVAPYIAREIENLVNGKKGIAKAGNRTIRDHWGN